MQEPSKAKIYLNGLKTSSQPVRGDVLRNALDDLDLWGEQFSAAIVKILQSKGLVFDARHYYTLHDIEKELKRLLGRESTQHISELLEIGVRAQYF